MVKVLIVLAVLGLLTACGGGGSSSNKPSTPVQFTLDVNEPARWGHWIERDKVGVVVSYSETSNPAITLITPSLSSFDSNQRVAENATWSGDFLGADKETSYLVKGETNLNYSLSSDTITARFNNLQTLQNGMLTSWSKSIPVYSLRYETNVSIRNKVYPKAWVSSNREAALGFMSNGQTAIGKVVNDDVAGVFKAVK